MQKPLLKLLMASALVLNVTIISFAGQWQMGQGPNIDRWCYLNDDGTWATDGWKMIDGKFYYFDADGWMLANTTTPDGGKVGADGAWIQEDSGISSGNTTNSSQDDPSIYPVKSAENVHWTDSFQLSWEFGKNRNGQLHHTYARCIYNANTGELLSQGVGNMNPRGTSVTIGISPNTTAKMESGSSYYFEVYALDESRKNQISPSVRSESKVYIRPSAVLPAPVTLSWDGTKIVYDLPGISEEMADQVHWELYFTPTQDGEYKKLDSGTTYVGQVQGVNLLNKMKAPGYYKYRVFLISKDIQKALPSEYSAFSPVYHYRK